LLIVRGQAVSDRRAFMGQAHQRGTDLPVRGTDLPARGTDLQARGAERFGAQTSGLGALPSPTAPRPGWRDAEAHHDLVA
jgi:hypothetical protein